MYYLPLLIAIAILTPACTTADTNQTTKPKQEQSAQLPDQKEVSALITQFQALNSKVESKINLNNFTQEVSNLKVAVDKFEKQNPQSKLLPIVKEIYQNYADAAFVWKYYEENAGDFKVVLIRYINPKREVKTNDYLPFYQKYSPPTKQILWLHNEQVEVVEQSAAVLAIWSKAKLNIQALEQEVN